MGNLPFGCRRRRSRGRSPRRIGGSFTYETTKEEEQEAEGESEEEEETDDNRTPEIADTGGGAPTQEQVHQAYYRPPPAPVGPPSQTPWLLDSGASVTALLSPSSAYPVLASVYSYTNRGASFVVGPDGQYHMAWTPTPTTTPPPPASTLPVQIPTNSSGSTTSSSSSSPPPPSSSSSSSSLSQPIPNPPEAPRRAIQNWKKLAKRINRLLFLWRLWGLLGQILRQFSDLNKKKEKSNVLFVELDRTSTHPARWSGVRPD